jgi:hypothetical protein
MPKRDNLTYLLQVNLMALKRLLDDVTEEESLERGRDNLPHIRWLTGHLVYSAGMTARQLGADYEPDGAYDRLFGRGSEVTDDAGIYPPFSELREELYELHDKAIAAASVATDEELDADLPKEAGFEATLMNAAQFLCMHTFYHAGQIAQLRRSLGRERSFG